VFYLHGKAFKLIKHFSAVIALQGEEGWPSLRSAGDPEDTGDAGPGARAVSGQAGGNGIRGAAED
jgi:hypothetical protein